MTVKKPSDLPGAWTNWDALRRDNGVLGLNAKDGVLTRDELKAYLETLTIDREFATYDGEPTLYIDMQIDSARKLYKDMTDAGVTEIQYLPEKIMQLPPRLRKRASELLTKDDVTSLGVIDQYVIDHARGRINSSIPYSGAEAMSREDALAEVNEIAEALGLE